MLDSSLGTKDKTSFNAVETSLAKIVFSAGQMMVVVFWNAKEIVFVEYLKGPIITVEYQAKLLRPMRESIYRKRPGKLTKHVFFHQNNAPSPPLIRLPLYLTQSRHVTWFNSLRYSPPLRHEKHLARRRVRDNNLCISDWEPKFKLLNFSGLEPKTLRLRI